VNHRRQISVAACFAASKGWQLCQFAGAEELASLRIKDLYDQSTFARLIGYRWTANQVRCRTPLGHDINQFFGNRGGFVHLSQPLELHVCAFNFILTEKFVVEIFVGEVQVFLWMLLVLGLYRLRRGADHVLFGRQQSPETLRIMFLAGCSGSWLVAEVLFDFKELTVFVTRIATNSKPSELATFLKVFHFTQINMLESLFDFGSARFVGESICQFFVEFRDVWFF